MARSSHTSGQTSSEVEHPVEVHRPEKLLVVEDQQHAVPPKPANATLRVRHEVLSDEMDEADLTAPSPEELSALRDRVAEALASGDPAPVKTCSRRSSTKSGWTADRPSTRSSVFLLAGTTSRTMRFAHRPGRWGRRDSNPHWRRFKRPASADWATSPFVQMPGTRANHRW